MEHLHPSVHDIYQGGSILAEEEPLFAFDLTFRRRSYSSRNEYTSPAVFPVLTACVLLALFVLTPYSINDFMGPGEQIFFDHLKFVRSVYHPNVKRWLCGLRNAHKP